MKNNTIVRLEYRYYYQYYFCFCLIIVVIIVVFILINILLIHLLGTTLLCTTTDEPSQIVPLLKRKDETTTIMKGHFRLFGDTVTIVATRLQKSCSEPKNRRRNRQISVQEHVFHMVGSLYCS